MNDKTSTVQPFDDGMADLLGYNPVWYWMMSFIILGIIMLTLFFLLRLMTDKKKAEIPQQPIQSPSDFVAEMDKSFLLVSNNVISPQEACQRASILMREYLHLQTGLPAGSMTVTELEGVQASPRVVQNLKYLYPIIFGDRKVATYEEFLEFMNSSRAVIEGRWN